MVDRTTQVQNVSPLLTEVLADLEKDFASRQEILRQAREKDVEFISQAVSESHTFLEEIYEQFSSYMQHLKNTEPDASFLTEFEIYIKDASAMLATKLQTAERHVLSESEWDRTWHNIDLAFDSAFVANEDKIVYEIYSNSENSFDDSEKVEIPIGEIIAQHLSEILPESRQRAKALMEQGRLDISQQVRAVWDVTRYNLEDTQAGLANYSPKKLETMTESLQNGLRRAINRLDDVVLETNRVWDDIKNELQSSQNQVLNEVSSDIRETSAGGKTKFIKTSKFLRRVVEQARISLIPRVAQTLTIIIASLKRTFYLPSRLRLDSVKTSQARKSIDEYDALSSENLYKRLPSIYSNLFSLESPVGEEFLLGRQKEYKIVQEALLRWSSGIPCSILNVGEKGSGKTSLINCCQKRFFSEFETLRGNIVERLTTEAELVQYISRLFGLPENLTFEQLVQTINAGEKRIVILTGCHNLYLRQMHGFDAFRGFLSLMAQTKLKVMWILSMDKYAWRYLVRAVPIDKLCFDYLINIQPMSKEDIREAILTRHNDSGYQLRYLMNDELRHKLRKQFKIWPDVTERQLQKALEDEFFDALYAASSGNISAAIFYWLNSLNFAGNYIEVQPLEPPEFQFLSDLSIEQSFALLAIMEHGTLNADELATVLDITHPDSLYILSLLANKRLIRKTKTSVSKANTFEESEGGYSINPIALKPIADELNKQNLIY